VKLTRLRIAIVVAATVAALDVDNPSLRRNLNAMVTKLAAFPVARTRPFFDSMEKAREIYDSGDHQAIVGKRHAASSSHFAVLVNTRS